MVKLRLKRCGRKQRVACQRGSFVDSYIHHLNYKCALGSTSFVLLHPTLDFFGLECKVVRDVARVETIDSVLKGKESRVSAN